jgi:hypothetical protein
MLEVYVNFFLHALRVACVLKCETTKSRVRKACRWQDGVEWWDKL